jgi:hypothetical protein
MTNILYIGPYRYNNILGMASRAIVQELSKNKNTNITTKNIFLENPYENTTLVNYNNFEKELSTQYDIIIQNTKPVMMVVDSKISQKNIAIPIMDYSLSEHDIQKLRMFSKVYTDDYHNLDILKTNKIQTEIFSYDIKPVNSNSTANLSYHNLNQKFYFIGNYYKNQSIINKIIVSFIVSFRSNNKVSLVLVLTDDDSTNVEKQVSSSIQDIFNKMNFNPVLSPIKIITQSVSIEQLHTIHRSCDVYFDLKDLYDTGLNKQLALIYNKQLIDIRSLKTVDVPTVDTQEQNPNSYRQSILTESIIKKISDIKNLENTKTPVIQNTISQLLCI